MIADTGPTKKRGPVSGETDQPGISEALSEYQRPTNMQGGNSFMRAVRLAAVSLTVAEFLEWLDSSPDGRADNALLVRQYREGMRHE